MSTIDRLRELEQAATPGPWKHGPLYWEVWNLNDKGETDTRVAGTWLLPDDAALIAEARNALPALLDVAEAARVLSEKWPNTRNSAIDGIRAALARLEGGA